MTNKYLSDYYLMMYDNLKTMTEMYIDEKVGIVNEDEFNRIIDNTTLFELANVLYKKSNYYLNNCEDKNPEEDIIKGEKNESLHKHFDLLQLILDFSHDFGKSDVSLDELINTVSLSDLVWWSQGKSEEDSKMNESEQDDSCDCDDCAEPCKECPRSCLNCSGSHCFRNEGTDTDVDMLKITQLCEKIENLYNDHCACYSCRCNDCPNGECTMCTVDSRCSLLDEECDDCKCQECLNGCNIDVMSPCANSK